MFRGNSIRISNCQASSLLETISGAVTLRDQKKRKSMGAVYYARATGETANGTNRGKWNDTFRSEPGQPRGITLTKEGGGVSKQNVG